jgi:RHS repeat-associated protein
VTPTYDGNANGNGNLTFDGTFTFSYDAENRLTSAVGAGNAASYSYDGQGRRKIKTVNNTTTVFVTDADNREVLEYDGSSGAIQRWYAYGLGSNAVLNQINVAAGTRTAFIPDIQGSVIASLDSTTATLTKISYLPYGKSASATAPFGYTAQRIDLETNGLYYYRARMYSPAWGRFIQPDPIGYGSGGNLYAYVGNDPLNALDSSGKLTFFTGGAGNNGSYIQSMVSALQSAGVTNVQTTPQNPWGMAGDLAILPLMNTYQGADFAKQVQAAPINVPPGEQLNMIGYSSGAALSAQAALVAAQNGQRVDNLVLIGAPITPSLLNAVRSEPNISNVQVIDLTRFGDPVHAGMSQSELAASIPTLAQQFMSGDGNGHFYYAANSAAGDTRRQELATQLVGSGLK